MKTYSLDELTDNYVGKKGTEKRNEFENELRKRESINDDPYFDNIKNIEEIEKGMED